jgi:hypothetical protein
VNKLTTNFCAAAVLYDAGPRGKGNSKETVSPKRRLVAALAAMSTLVIMVIFSTACSKLPEHQQTNSKEPGQSAQQLVAKAWGSLPLTFEENRGQTDAQVKYLARGTDYVLFLTPQEAVLSLKVRTSNGEKSAESGSKSGTTHNRFGMGANPAHGAEETAAKTATLRFSLSGAQKNAEPIAEARQPGPSNFFIGNDPNKWTTDVPSYGRVRYRDVYPGIDLVYYGNQRQLEYDFIVAPGADPDPIRLAIQGARKAHVDASGNLVLGFDGRDVVQHKPIVYQEVDGRRVAVAGEYRLDTKANEDGPIEVAFTLGEHDRARALVIDPVLVYSTFLSGGQGDIVRALAVDSTGNLYAAGATNYADFPVVGGLPPDQGGVAPSGGIGNDAIFVSKLNPAGDTLLYSTYLSGNAQTLVFAMQVDGQGAAYLTGFTAADNFPIVGGLPPDQAYQMGLPTPSSQSLTPLAMPWCIPLISLRA